MDGISGVGTYSGYDGYQRGLQGLFVPVQAETSEEEAETAPGEGIGYGVSAGPVTAPSLLVAVQEAEQNSPEIGVETKKIQGDGVVSWVQENWVDRIRATARSQALARLGVTEAQLAAMSPNMQAQIEQAVAQAVKAAMVGLSGHIGAQGIVA